LYLSFPFIRCFFQSLSHFKGNGWSYPSSGTSKSTLPGWVKAFPKFIKWTSDKESIQLFKNVLLKRHGIQQNDTNQMTVMFFFYFLSNVIVRGIILLNAIPLNVVEPIFNLNFRGQPAVLYSFDNKNK